MTRRRWVYVNGEAYEVGIDHVPSTNTQRAPTDAALWGDRHYDGMRATDGTDISTRTKHREYMKANGLTTIDDFKEHNERAQRARDAYRTTGAGGAVTREHIERAIHDLQTRR